MTALEKMEALQINFKGIGIDLNMTQAQDLLAASRAAREGAFERIANDFIDAKDQPFINKIEEILLPFDENSREDREQMVETTSEDGYGLAWVPNGSEVVAEPNQAFWADWRENKASLKKEGYKVSKNIYKWEVSKPA